MVPQSQGKIFLSDERGHHELDWFRSYHTFNFGQYQQQHKAGIGPLYVLNDETLAGGKSLILAAEQDSDILLVPVVGALSLKDSAGNACIIEAGQSYLTTALAGTAIELSNPYEEDLVNFLQVWFKQDALFRVLSSEGGGSVNPQLFSFDINADKNKLIELFPAITESAHSFNKPYGRQFIGKFAGRAEMIHTISSPYNGLFVFVIEGAFEVQYRLLHARDGLALWDLQEVEFEALSNDAIIWVCELSVESGELMRNI